MNRESDHLDSRLRRSMDARRPAPELDPGMLATAADRTPPWLVNQRRARVVGGLGVGAFALAAVTVTALVVTPPTTSGEPLFVASAPDYPAGRAAALESASLNDLSYPSEDWIDYRFEPGAGLPTEGGTGTVYQLKRKANPGQVLSSVAREFDVAGSPGKSEYFDETYPTYVIGSESGDASAVTVTWMGTGDWWFYDPSASTDVVCATLPEGGEALPDDPCAAPGVVADSLAPNEDEARARAAKVFAATGLDVAPDDISVEVSESDTSAFAYLTVGGQQTSIEWSMGWDAATGKVAWARGHSIEVVERGDFGTVSASEAVSRIADGRWFGAGGPEYDAGLQILDARIPPIAEPAPLEVPLDSAPVPDPVPDPSEPAPVEPAQPRPVEPTPTDPGFDEPIPTEPFPDEPLPGEPAPGTPPEQVVAPIDEADATLLTLWDSEGNAWLVPGFAMQHPAGGWITIVSLVDGVIELPAPITLDQPQIQPREDDQPRDAPVD